jgi:hypothetical protein
VEAPLRAPGCYALIKRGAILGNQAHRATSRDHRAQSPRQLLEKVCGGGPGRRALYPARNAAHATRRQCDAVTQPGLNELTACWARKPRLLCLIKVTTAMVRCPDPGSHALRAAMASEGGPWVCAPPRRHAL